MRTQSNGIELRKNGLYSIKFATYKGVPGNEYLVNEVESAALFDTEDEAYSAQKRVLDILEATDRYPNMCEKF